MSSEAFDASKYKCNTVVPQIVLQELVKFIKGEGEYVKVNFTHDGILEITRVFNASESVIRMIECPNAMKKCTPAFRRDLLIFCTFLKDLLQTRRIPLVRFINGNLHYVPEVVQTQMRDIVRVCFPPPPPPDPRGFPFTVLDHNSL